MGESNILYTIKHNDINSFDIETLTTYAIALEDEAANIDRQLIDARAEQRVTGMYADAQWYARAMNAMKERRRWAMKLRVHVKKNRVVESDRVFVDENRQRYAECFIKAAKTLLHEDVVANIEELAQHLHTV
jgi:hypothetical protein